LKEHLEQLRGCLGEYPERLIADAGYGSKENYDYLRKRNITAYVKHNTFHPERKNRYKKKMAYRAETFTHFPEQDQFVCPQGKILCYQFAKKNTQVIMGMIHLGAFTNASIVRVVLSKLNV